MTPLNLATVLQATLGVNAEIVLIMIENHSEVFTFTDDSFRPLSFLNDGQTPEEDTAPDDDRKSLPMDPLITREDTPLQAANPPEQEAQEGE